MRSRGTAVAIGVFDGVHLGHKALLTLALGRARAHRLAPVAVTFDRHPLAVLRPQEAPTLLMTLHERLAALRRAGFRRVVVLRFDRRLARMSAEDFVRDILVRRLRVRELIVGHDFRFGRGGRGNDLLLRRMGARLGFRVDILPALRIGGRTVSSTRLREIVARGSLEKVRRLTGAPFRISGRIVRGAGIARTLGFPTINILPDPGHLLPRLGVYAVRLRPGGRPAVANLGVKPTFKRALRHPLLEAHCLRGRPRFRHGARVSAELLRFIRPERKFASAAALQGAVAKDIRRARKALQ